VLDGPFSGAAGPARPPKNGPGSRKASIILKTVERRPARPRRYRLSIVTLAGSLLLPVQVRGQSIPSPYQFLEQKQEAGLFSGYLSAETGRFGFGPSGGTLLGGRYGIELTGPLSLEGVLGLISGKRDIINPGRIEGEQLVGEGDVLLTTIDARLRFSFTGARSWHGLSPFLAAGGGVVFDAAGTPEVEADLEPADVFDFGTSFFGTLGAGTRWFLTDTFALRLDGVFSLWGIDTPPGYSDPERGLANVAESEWMSGLSFSVSLLYRW
jgi:hypothetical protein